MENQEPQECIICFLNPVSPFHCSTCKKWVCRGCFLNWRKTGEHTCPMNCVKSEMVPVPLEKEIANNYKTIKCRECDENVMMHNYADHSSGHEFPEFCLYQKLCRGFGAFRLKDSPHQFCSDLCVDTYFVSKKMPLEMAADIRDNLKNHRSLFEEANLLPKERLPRIELDPSSLSFHLHKNSDPQFRQLSGVDFEFSGQDRHYCTAYNQTRISSTQTQVFLTLDHHTYFKIGVCIDAFSRPRFCFSDSEVGFGFVSCGQIREGSNSFGKVVGPPLPMRKLRLCININCNTGSFKVCDLDDPDRVYDIKFSEIITVDKYFLAIAFKKPQKFSLKVIGAIGF